MKPKGLAFTEHLSVWSPAVAFMLAISGCSSDSDGCKKDTECASGRICGVDGRCVAADTPPPTGGGGGQGTPPTGQPVTDCDAYYYPDIPKCGDPCRCGAQQILSPATGCRCGYSCVTSDECARTAWASGVRNLDTLCYPATKYEPSVCGFFKPGYPGGTPVHP